MGFGRPLVQNLNDGRDQLRVGPAGRIDVQDSALAVLINVTRRLADAFVRIERELKHRQSEFFVSRAR